MSLTYESISVTETAKLIRAALKRAFPGVRFSIRSERYAGGASVDVEWSGTPPRRQVMEIARSYQGKNFDGMIDGSVYLKHWLLPDGSTVLARNPGTKGSGGTIDEFNSEKPHPAARLVCFGADYVQTNHWDG